MVVLVVAIVFALMTIGLAAQANSRFKHVDELPMQWLLSRSKPLSQTVVRSAPRRAALGFIPCLAIGSLALFTAVSLTMKPRPGQEGYVVPALLAFGAVFIGVQILHLWMIARSLRR